MSRFESVNILLVDDRQENLDLLGEMLKCPGYRLVTALSALEALRLTVNESFAVVLVDLRMPDMDGIELAARIKAQPRSHDLPILIVTSYRPDPDTVLRAYGAGAVDYLVRPVQPSVLRAKVAIFADLYRKTEQLKDQARMLSEHAERDRKREIKELRSQQERRMAIVAEVSRLLSESLDLSTSLDKVARYLVGAMTRGCVIEISDEEGKPMKVAIAHQSPSHETRLREQYSRRRAAQDSDTLVTPIETRGRTAGALALLGTTSAGGWDPEEREFVSDIARRIGLFVDNAALLEKARKAVDARDEFLSIAAHELRTPLTAMMLHIQALGRTLGRKGTRPAQPEAALRRIDSAERQLARLVQLIEELLDVSRIASRRLKLEPETVELHRLAQDVAAKFADAAAREGGTIEVRVEQSAVGVWDPIRIEQVLTNLVGNALKYGPGKPVVLTVRRSGRTAEVSVRDQGIGIPPESLQRIFDRFERAVPSISYGGLGLGLYIAHELVTAHGGSIDVSSEVGKGTELTVRLPLPATAAGSGAELLDDAEQFTDLEGFAQHP